MAAYLDNYSGELVFTAPTGGVTLNTALAIQDCIVLPRATAAAAATFVGYVLNAPNGKMVRGIAKAAGTGLDWIQGELLYWDDSEDKLTTIATGNNAVAFAAATATAAATSGDAVFFGGAGLNLA